MRRLTISILRKESKKTSAISSKKIINFSGAKIKGKRWIYEVQDISKV